MANGALKKIACGMVIALVSGGLALAEGPEEKKVEYKPKLSGYIEGWYRSDDSDLSNQATSSKKVDNEFRVRRARLTASGNVSEELSYKLTASLDGPTPASSASTVRLWDAYVTYTFNPLAAVTAGQIKYDFSLEGLEATPDRVPVLRSEAVNDIAGKLGTKGGSFRDIGVKLNGSYEKFLNLTYGLDVINGSGMNAGDNNAEKDIVARASISPVEGLTIGASGYKGKGQDQTEERFEVQETAYGADAEYHIQNLKLRGEYITGKWENWDVATSSAASGRKQNPWGWYLQASYKLPPVPALELMGRFEDYRKDSYTADSDLKTTTLGAAYYIKGKSRIAVNYLIRNPGGSPIVTAQETDATGSRIGNLLLIQALLVF